MKKEIFEFEKLAEEMGVDIDLLMTNQDNTDFEDENERESEVVIYG